MKRLLLLAGLFYAVSALVSGIASGAEGKEAGERMVIKIEGIDVAFRWCPAGKFMMGSPKNEKERDSDESQHQVTLTQGFWMAETETTQALWTAVTGNNRSHFKGDKLAVETVGWNDCQEFIAKLNKDGAAPLGMKFALPTEAQWEYACRAETTGNYAGNLDEMGWYRGNSGAKTHEVGTKKANGWGLYDMHGNVWEWCIDWYGDYPTGSVTDPHGANASGARVCRGGSWDYDAEYCRSAERNGGAPGKRYDDNSGFRLVLLLQR